MSSSDLAEMIFEIVGKSPKITFSGDSSQEHYRITPYRYSPRSAKKLVPSEFVDLGQGILEICEELSADPDVN